MCVGLTRQTSEASGAILGELFTPEDEHGGERRVEEGDSLLPRPPCAREGPAFWQSDVAFAKQFTQVRLHHMRRLLLLTRTQQSVNV